MTPNSTQGGILPPNCSEIGCIPLTNGAPSLDDVPAKDQLPIRLDPVTSTIYFYECCNEVWLPFVFVVDTDTILGEPVLTNPIDGDGQVCFEFSVLDAITNLPVDPPQSRTICIAEPTIDTNYSIANYIFTDNGPTGTISFDVVDVVNGNLVISTESVTIETPDFLAGNADIVINQDVDGNWVFTPVDKGSICDQMPDIPPVITKLCF